LVFPTPYHSDTYRVGRYPTDRDRRSKYFATHRSLHYHLRRPVTLSAHARHHQKKLGQSYIEDAKIKVKPEFRKNTVRIVFDISIKLISFSKSVYLQGV